MNNPLEVKPVSALKMMSPLIIFIVIAAAWSMYWFTVRQQTQDTVARYVGKGLPLSCTEQAWGGYPFRITFDCSGVNLTVNESPLTADKLRLILQPWNTNHIIGALFGPITYNDMVLNGDAIRISHRSENGKLALASLIAENQTLTIDEKKQFKIAKVSGHARSKDQSNLIEYTGLLEQITMDKLALDNFKLDGTYDPSATVQNDLVLNTEPSEYLDAIWMVQSLADLGDTEMNAAEAVIKPLLKSNNNKLLIQRKDGIWYWGPFPLQKQGN